MLDPWVVVLQPSTFRWCHYIGKSRTDFLFFLQLGNQHKFISVYRERGDISAEWNPWESEPLASAVNLCFVYFLKTNLMYIVFIWWWKIYCVYSHLWLRESDNIEFIMGRLNPIVTRWPMVKNSRTWIKLNSLKQRID